MNLRRQSRELALQALYQDHINSDSHFHFEYFAEKFNFKTKTIPFASTLKKGVSEKKEIIDEMIKKELTDWKIERLNSIDVAVLRIALFESLFSEEKTPVKVVINEAIELSKKYGAEKSSEFVNGVLDKILIKKNVSHS